MNITSTTTYFAAAIFVVGLSGSAFASDYDTSADHNHGGNTSDTSYPMNMAKGNPQKEQMMKAMQAEMQTIIDTEDKAKRQALFTAHKEKMQGMKGMMQNNMQGDCNGKAGMMEKGSKPIDHQAETD